jgi:hypothetical protein
MHSGAHGLGAWSSLSGLCSHRQKDHSGKDDLSSKQTSEINILHKISKSIINSGKMSDWHNSLRNSLLVGGFFPTGISFGH